MIRALRRTRLAPFAVALALFATGPITVSSLLHDGMDDEICNPTIVVHNAEAHRIGGAGHETVPESQHCVLCHALQSLRAVAHSVRFTAPTIDGRLTATTAAGALNPQVVSDRPARAPPIA
ncbi:MAG TPA: hypothetical protein VL693_16010 [Vicinamibacterales bacterium]|jgi:hypothetical protein|nr:hypothetical protein [Vicinamibacterales bacterium]